MNITQARALRHAVFQALDRPKAQAKAPKAPKAADKPKAQHKGAKA